MIDPYRRRRTHGTGIRAKEKKNLWILGCAFALLVIAFVSFGLLGKKESDEAKSAREAENALDRAAPTDRDGSTVVSVVPPQPYEVRDRVEDEIREKLAGFRGAGKLGDGVKPDDPELLEYLVNAGMWNYRVTRTPVNVYRTIDPVEWAFEPGPHRGKLVSAWGPVVSVLDPTPFPDRVRGVDTLYRVRFRSAEGQLFELVSALKIDWKPDEWIQTFGIFYRHRKVETVQGPETAFCLAHVTEHSITKAYPPMTVTELDPGWAAEIGESNLDEAHSLDERPFYLVMNYVKNLGPEGYEKLRKSEGFQISDFGRIAKPVLADRQRHRFRFIAAEGRITALWWDVLRKDNPGKIGRIDAAFLWQPTEYVVRLVTPFTWDEYGLDPDDPEHDYVRVEGIFYKEWWYIPSRGGDAYKVPLVVVTGIYPIEEPESGILKYLGWGIGIFAAGIVVFFFVMAFRDRRKYAEFREEYAQKKKLRELAEEEAAGDASGPEEPGDGP